MPPSGKCLRRIAPAATMVEEFVETTQSIHKTQLVAGNYGTFWSLAARISYPKMDPLLSSSMRQAAEEPAQISSYQMLSVDKK